MRKIFLLPILLLIFTGLVGFDGPAEPSPEAGTPIVDPEAQTTGDRNSEGPKYTGCGGQIVPGLNDAYEARVVELVNQARAAEGLPPLKRAEPMTEAARYHAADMGLDNYVDHDTFDRVGGNLTEVCGVWDRIATYFSGPTGENAAAGYSTPEAVMEGWMNSPGHRANILNPASWEIGVGYFAGSGDYGIYWVQDFGRQPGVYPVVIAGESVATSSRYVLLNVYGEWQQMRLRNDSGAWTSWMPFSPQFAWILNQGKGEHAVTLELKDGTQTVSTSDTIYLDNDSASLLLTNLPVIQRLND